MPKMNHSNPQNDPQEEGFLQKVRSMRVNRAVFLSAVVILLALAVILVITAVTNRARRKNAQDVLNPVNDTPTTQNEPEDKPGEKEDPQPGNSDPKPDKPAPTVPTLSLPVEGTLLQQHSADVQVFSRTLQDWRVHLGIDLATEEGAPVLAAADGTVARIWDDPMMGKCVAVSHEAEALTVYKNLAEDLPEDIVAGAAVLRGQRIGTVGESAMLEVAEEPHLHLEMTVDGKQVNPLDYFPAAAISSLAIDNSYEDTVNEK